MTERKNIAVIGAGFGGLRAALLIGAKLKKLGLETIYRIVLIDRNDYHTYTPTLYEVATNDPEYTSYADVREIVTLPLASLIQNLPIEFVNTHVDSINLKQSVITCAEVDPISYHYLVLAPGSEPNYFDISGLEKFSTPLKTFRDSIEIREYILAALRHKTELIQIVIGGGGSAGVELAGEVRSWLNRLQIESGGARRSEVTIIETAATVLAPFPPKIITTATRRLTQIGVKTIANERIASVRDKMIMLATGKTVPFDLLVWTGGVKASSLMSPLELAKDTKGRVVVADTLECSPAENGTRLSTKIYALGDAVVIMNKKTNQPVPGTAHAALVQATVVAHNLIEDIQLYEGIGSSPNFKTYTPGNYPYIIPIGGKYTVARVGTIIISGFFGWILKGLVELYYFCSLMPISRAFKLWVKGFGVIVKNDRIR